MFITPRRLIAVTNTPIVQCFHILRLFLAHVIVKCRSEGCVVGSSGKQIPRRSERRPGRNVCERKGSEKVRASLQTVGWT